MAVAKKRKSRRSSRRPAGRHHGSAPERRPYREIEIADVGKKRFKAFGKSWRVEEFIGQILPQDVGKRVVLVGDIVQVENDQQRDARVRARGTPHKGGRFGNSEFRLDKEKFQGWTNWPTWSVNLWMSNDHQAYRAWQHEYDTNGPLTAKRAEALVREIWPRGTPDKVSGAYMGRHGGYKAVNWAEVAEAMNER